MSELDQSTIGGRVFSILKYDLEDSNQIDSIIENVKNALLVKINATTVPKQLEFIVVEASIARYRQLGSEGMKSETIDAHTMSFHDDLFAPFKTIIDEWKFNNKSLAKVRFV